MHATTPDLRPLPPLGLDRLRPSRLRRTALGEGVRRLVTTCAAQAARSVQALGLPMSAGAGLAHRRTLAPTPVAAALTQAGPEALAAALASAPTARALCYRPVRADGVTYRFPCDATGQVDIDALSERSRTNYLFARACVGRDFQVPTVETLAWTPSRNLSASGPRAGSSGSSG